MCGECWGGWGDALGDADACVLFIFDLLTRALLRRGHNNTSGFFRASLRSSISSSRTRRTLQPHCGSDCGWKSATKSSCETTTRQQHRWTRQDYHYQQLHHCFRPVLNHHRHRLQDHPDRLHSTSSNSHVAFSYLPR